MRNTFRFVYNLVGSGTPVDIICTKSQSKTCLVVDKDTDDEINFQSLCAEDKESILALASEWRDYYKDMKGFADLMV